MDATTILTVYLVLLLAIPSPMVLSPLGSAGAPSALLAPVIFLIWLWFTLRGTAPVAPAGPSRVALVWLLVMVVVYAHAMSLPIPSDEVSPADNGLIKVVGYVGILVMASDGIASAERHRVLVRRLVVAVGLVAVLGLVQYLTRELYVDRLNIPGLTSGTSGWGLIIRNGYPRPSGTSTHPIEYGVVLTMALPLAVAFARSSPSWRLLYRLVLVAIAFAVFLSISRSTLVCAFVGVAVMIIGSRGWQRLWALLGLLACAVVIYLTVPGVLGTIVGLFTSVSQDPSIASRTGSYELAWSFIQQQPLFGRGFGTFLPKYWILDNGYLGMLIEAGVLGLGCLLAVLGTAFRAAWLSRRRALTDFDRDLSLAFMGSVAAGSAGLAFFDTFGFPQSAGCFFLVIGLAGGMLRFAGTGADPAVVQRDQPRVAPRVRQP
ncbi:MAG: O-antigen ligase family protein [Actinomycetales bacterium]